MEHCIPHYESVKSRQENIARSLETEGLHHVSERPKPQTSTSFINKPLNSEGVHFLEKTEIENYFQKFGIETAPPLTLGQGTYTTLFPVAGIQKLEPIFYEEGKIPTNPIFIAQPVLRTQFLEHVGPGTSTSFVNICSEHVNPTAEEHLSHMQLWLNFLNKIGIKKTKLAFWQTTSEEYWNSQKIPCEVTKLYFEGLEIGDGVYIPNFPQKKRAPLKVSDIGFGCERLQWILRGGAYLPGKHEMRIQDAARGLALIVASRVKPGNTGRGYRHRLFSKRLAQSDLLGKETLRVISESYAYWRPWLTDPQPLQETLDMIKAEYNRNLHRIILESLVAHQPNVDININFNTENFLKGLRDAALPKKRIQEIEIRLTKQLL